MTLVFEVDPGHLDEAEPGLAAAEEALAGGELVVFPTETVYGLASRPDDPDATDRLFRAKQRPLELNLPVLAGSTAAAWEAAEPSPAARALAAAFWPGPLTLVLARTEGSRRWHLGSAMSTVAVRVPDHPLSLALLGRTGSLAVTSANPSGQPSISDPERLVAAFGESVAVYLLLKPSVPGPSGSASTIVDVVGTIPIVLREGLISGAAIDSVLEHPT